MSGWINRKLLKHTLPVVVTAALCAAATRTATAASRVTRPVLGSGPSAGGGRFDASRTAGFARSHGRREPGTLHGDDGKSIPTDDNAQGRFDASTVLGFVRMHGRREPGTLHHGDNGKVLPTDENVQGRFDAATALGFGRARGRREPGTLHGDNGKVIATDGSLQGHFDASHALGFAPAHGRREPGTVYDGSEVKAWPTDETGGNRVDGLLGAGSAVAPQWQAPATPTVKMWDHWVDLSSEEDGSVSAQVGFTFRFR